MLLRFKFSNSRSFRAEQEFSLVAGPFKDLPESVLHPPGLGYGVLPAAGIYGANASGKTNVIRALQFAASAVVSSQREWQPDGSIPREPFVTEEDGTPSLFEADVLLEGVRHQYGFIVDSNAVLKEWLYVYPNGKKQIWFERNQGRPISFGKKMPGENRAIESLTRRNSLFLSAAAQNNHEALLAVYKWFSGSLCFVVRDRAAWMQRTVELCTHDDYRDTVVKLLSFADLGISQMSVKQVKMPDDVKKIWEVVISELGAAKLPVTPTALPEFQSHFNLQHQLGNQAVSFQNQQESEGTIAYLALLSPIITALKSGGTVCVDELDASLHPLLAIQLMRMFNSNKSGAQLIFTTHDTNLLSAGVLRRDQVWFTEKKNDGSSHLYPLSDFKPRKNESLENGYLQGRYGAIPFLNSDAFLRCLENADAEA